MKRKEERNRREGKTIQRFKSESDPKERKEVELS